MQNGWVIGLDDNAGLGELNQMSDLLNHLYETCDLKLRRPVIFFGNGKEPRKKEKWLDWAAARPTALRQIFIGGGIKDNRFESKLFGDIQVSLQGFVRVVMYESWGVAQGLLNALE